MLTDEQIEEIRTREAKATPGPWKNDGPDRFSFDEPWVHVVDGPTNDTLLLAKLPCEFPDNRPHDERLGLCGNASNDAEFVAHSRTDIPALLADRDEMQKLLREAVRQLNRTECAGCDEEGNCDDPLCEEIDAFLSSPAVQELVK